MMHASAISARFASPEALEAALWDLRRLGAVCCSPGLAGGTPAGSTLHVTVRPGDASMARAILRRAGGVIL